MAGRRQRNLLLGAVVVACGILVVAANFPWFDVTLRDDGGALEVPGSAAAPALNGIALAGMACVGAAALAPRVLRYVLAGILAVLGGAAVAAVLAPLADPLGAVERSVSTVTGVSGREPVAALVAGSPPTAWPGVAIAAAVAVVVLAIAIAVTARRWPGSRRRYSAEGPRSASDPWDALSRGTDPTRETGDGAAPLDSDP